MPSRSARNGHLAAYTGYMANGSRTSRHAREQSVLCSALQPDKLTGHCILYSGHEGPHHTFVAEWQEGATTSRRRQPRFTMSQRFPGVLQAASARIPQMTRRSF